MEKAEFNPLTSNPNLLLALKERNSSIELAVIVTLSSQKYRDILLSPEVSGKLETSKTKSSQISQLLLQALEWYDKGNGISGFPSLEEITALLSSTTKDLPSRVKQLIKSMLATLEGTDSLED